MGGMRQRPVCHLNTKGLRLCKWLFVLYVHDWVKWKLWTMFYGWEQSFQKYLQLVHDQCIQFDPESPESCWFTCYNLNGYMVSLAKACQRDDSFWEEDYM